MRIHRLTLTHVKGVESRELVLPDEGVVVVEGENEAGKTTMIEALDLLFDEKDSSRKRHVLAMRPVGQDVPSSVEVEATSGPYRFVYRKQWFRRPSTELTVLAPQRENLTGSAAHDRARAILEETTDPALWRALRLMQATPLTGVDLAGSAALSDALDRAAGHVGASSGGDADVDTADGDSLLETVEGAYAEFFTATGRPTGEYRRAAELLEEARRAREEARAAVAEVAEDVRRHEALVRETARLEAQLRAGESLRDELRHEWSAAQEVVRRAEQAASATALARQSFESASDRLRDREDLVALVAERRAAAARAETEHARLAAELDPTRVELEAATARLDQARARQKQARSAASRAESDVALVADLMDLASVARRLRGLEGALARRHEARSRRDAHRFTASLPDLERAAHAVDLARAEWRAGSASWTLTPESDEVTVLVDGKERRLDAEVTEVLGAAVEFTVPGVVRLRVAPPEGGASRADVVARAESALAAALDDAGVEDLASARAAAATSSEAEAELRDAERELAALSGGESAEEWRDRGERLLRHVAELVARRRDDEAPPPLPGVGASDPSAEAAPAAPLSDDASQVEAPLPMSPGDAPDAAGSTSCDPPISALTGEKTTPAGSVGADPGQVHVPTFDTWNAVDVDDEAVARVVRWIQGTDDPSAGLADLQRAAASARAAETDAESEITGAEAALDTVRHRVDAGRLAVARAEVLWENAASALADAESRLAVAREKVGDDDLQGRVHEARAVLGQALERDSDVQADVARVDPDSLRVRLEGAENAAQSLRRRFGEARDERLQLEARLRHAGEQGRAERLSEAESALAKAERRHTALTRRAGAARRLYETLTRHRTAMRTAYVEPFGRAVSRLGRVVYGSDFDVEIGDGLQIEARILGSERIPYEALSTGAKEQMSIITRLACASLVDPEQGAPVILDDALGYADPRRLQRVCSAFSLVGGGTQIILLTCTPGRYAGIPDAHVIRL